MSEALPGDDDDITEAVSLATGGFNLSQDKKHKYEVLLVLPVSCNQNVHLKLQYLLPVLASISSANANN